MPMVLRKRILKDKWCRDPKIVQVWPRRAPILHLSTKNVKCNVPWLCTRKRHLLWFKIVNVLRIEYLEIKIKEALPSVHDQIYLYNQKSYHQTLLRMFWTLNFRLTRAVSRSTPSMIFFYFTRRLSNITIVSTTTSSRSTRTEFRTC